MSYQPVFAHNWLESPHLENPYPLFAEARQTAPVFYSPIFNLWCVTRYRDVRTALSDPQRFSSKFLIRTPYTAPAEVTDVLSQAYSEEQILVNEDPPDHSRLLLFGAANHDDEIFVDPERFDIDRANKEQHLGFGRGIHFCVGATLARLEVRIAIRALAARIPSARLDPNYRPTYLPSLLHRGPQQLHLVWDRV